MLTPRFVLSQTDDDIIIKVHAPYANVAETEVYIHENDVRFHSSPYYLRLNLPGYVEENDGSRAMYDVDSGEFEIWLGKTTPGQHFPDLDMITTLLAPKPSSANVLHSIGPDISIVGSVPGEDSENDLEDEEVQWFVDQLPMAEDDSKLEDHISYGFANLQHSVFKKLEMDIPKLVDLPKPDATPQRERERLRVEDELRSFNEGHYLADLMDACDEDSALPSVLAYKGPWERQPDEFPSLSGSDLDVLKEFPNKEYLMEERERISCYLGIVDLLFAYAYDQRTTEGSGNVESGWTIAKLSPMLSWLQTFSSLNAVVISCLRRSLCFPLYRHWELSLRVLQDTRHILQLGKAGVLKCLFHIYTVFNANDPQYVLNRLYIRDYCIWIQKTSEKKIGSLADALNKLLPKKEELGLGLEELESVIWKCKAEEIKTCETSSKINYSDKSIDIIEHNLSKMVIHSAVEKPDSDDGSSFDGSSSSETSTISSEETDDDTASSESDQENDVKESNCELISS